MLKVKLRVKFSMLCFFYIHINKSSKYFACKYFYNKHQNLALNYDKNNSLYLHHKIGKSKRIALVRNNLVQPFITRKRMCDLRRCKKVQNMNNKV